MRARRCQHRGGMYLAVLMIAMIVTIIGMSALAVTRIQLRSTEGGGDAAAARLHAQSAIEMGAFTISNDSNWRSTYTHDTWVSDEPIGTGTYTWKLVDEGYYGDLTTDPSSPVRLYGKGYAGDAIRTYSILLEFEGGSAAANLLSNPGMESGTSGWYGYDCDIASDPNAHSGSASLLIDDRYAYYSGSAQDVDGFLENGTTYEMEAWVKMDSGTSNMRFVMYVRDSIPNSYWLIAGETSVDDSGWTKITGTMTPSWGGTLVQAFWKVSTVSGTTDFYVDDAVLQVEGGGEDPTIIPRVGSLQRVVD